MQLGLRVVDAGDRPVGSVVAPFVLARLPRWQHRGTFLAAWEDIVRLGE